MTTGAEQAVDKKAQQLMEATFGTFMTSFLKLAKKIPTEFLPDAVERQPCYGTSVMSLPHSSSEDILRNYHSLTFNP